MDEIDELLKMSEQELSEGRQKNVLLQGKVDELEKNYQELTTQLESAEVRQKTKTKKKAFFCIVGTERKKPNRGGVESENQRD